MKIDALIKMIRADTCNGCPVMEACSLPGAFCLLPDMAADALENAAKEKQACFRLGQMDMRESIADMLLALADGTQGVVCSTLIDAAERVRKLETG